jgi:hypothetical protein
MKIAVYIFISISLLSCRNSNSIKKEDTTQACINSKTFGDIEVCLPNVQGMVECYENEDIKSYVSNFDFEVNQIIGFYLTQNDYDNFNSSDKPKMDGYLKIYSPKKMKNQEINNSNLDEMVQIFKKNFLESNWDKISEKIEELGTNLRIDSPILMENYEPNETTRTFITFNKIASETYEDFQISALNLMNIKNRLIWVVYYKSYTGPESIQDLKRKNDYLIGKIAMSNLDN